MHDADEQLIRHYYAGFNERRIADSAALVSEACEFKHLSTRDHTHGPRGYVALVEDWTRASPDVTLTPETITPLEPGLYRVALRLRGHLHGRFDIGPMALAGNGKSFDFLGTHDLTLRDGLIVASTFSFDRGDLVRSM